MLGGFAQALFFVITLVLTVIFGTYSFLYLASVLLIVIGQTASGDHEVKWPDEPTIDRILRAVHVLWLAAVWIAPAGLLMRVLTHFTAPEMTLPLTIVAIGVAFWLFFPIGVLSSLSSESPWVPLRPAILGGMLKCFPTTLGFYAVSAVLVGGSLALVVLTCASGLMALVPVAGIVSATLLLIWARLIGRLGWVVSHALAKAPTKTESKPKRKSREKRRARRVRQPKAQVTDPWAKPKKEEEQEPKQPSRTPWGGIAEPVEGYGLSVDKPQEEEKPKPRRDYFPDEDVSPYDMSAFQEPPPPPEDHPPPEAIEPDKVEMNRGQLPPPPAHPMLQGVYNFPWYSGTLTRWIWMCAVLSGVIFLIQLLIGLIPG
jgi:hypothetical protein